jgi:hypothetical protein
MFHLATGTLNYVRVALPLFVETEFFLHTPLALLRMPAATAQKDMLDLFGIVVFAFLTDVAKAGEKGRLPTIQVGDAAALLRRRVGGVLMDETIKYDGVRKIGFAIVRPPGDLYLTGLHVESGTPCFHRHSQRLSRNACGIIA